MRATDADYNNKRSFSQSESKAGSANCAIPVLINHKKSDTDSLHDGKQGGTQIQNCALKAMTNPDVSTRGSSNWKVQLARWRNDPEMLGNDDD